MSASPAATYGPRSARFAALGAAGQGFALGIALIWQPGPQNLYVFEDAIKHSRSGWAEAVTVSVVASLCDTLLIVLALTSVAKIQDRLEHWRVTLKVAVGTYLILLGIYSIVVRPDLGTSTNAVDHSSLGAHVVATIMLSLPNVHALLEIFGVIGAFSVGFPGTLKIYFGVGNVLASWCWFCSLTIMGHLLGPTVLKVVPPPTIATGGGVILCLLGAVSIVVLLRRKHA